MIRAPVDEKYDILCSSLYSMHEMNGEAVGH